MNIDWTGSKANLLGKVDDAEIHGHLPSPLARQVRQELNVRPDETYWLRIDGDPNDDTTWQIVLLRWEASPGYPYAPGDETPPCNTDPLGPKFNDSEGAKMHDAR